MSVIISSSTFCSCCLLSPSNRSCSEAHPTAMRTYRYFNMAQSTLPLQSSLRWRTRCAQGLPAVQLRSFANEGHCSVQPLHCSCHAGWLLQVGCTNQHSRSGSSSTVQPVPYTLGSYASSRREAGHCLHTPQLASGVALDAHLLLLNLLMRTLNIACKLLLDKPTCRLGMSAKASAAVSGVRLASSDISYS